MVGDTFSQWNLLFRAKIRLFQKFGSLSKNIKKIFKTILVTFWNFATFWCSSDLPQVKHNLIFSITCFASHISPQIVSQFPELLKFQENFEIEYILVASLPSKTKTLFSFLYFVPHFRLALQFDKNYIDSLSLPATSWKT